MSFMKLTVVCPIILISHIVKLFLTRKFYCFRNGQHIYFKYARHNHLHCPMMGEVFLWLVLLDEKFVSAIKEKYIRKKEEKEEENHQSWRDFKPIYRL